MKRHPSAAERYEKLILKCYEMRDVAIRAPGVGPVHAQLEPSGLFYSYSPAASPSRGRIAFVPLSRLP